MSSKSLISNGFSIKSFAEEIAIASPLSAFAENKIIGSLESNCLSSLHISVPNFPGKRILIKLD